jgi:hypothetical protein
MTTKELMDSISLDTNIDCWFPEISEHHRGLLTEQEQMIKCPRLVGMTFVTVSEIFILFMLREIRKSRMRTNELELWCGDTRIGVDIKGDMINDWDGGFFEMGFNLRFH